MPHRLMQGYLPARFSFCHTRLFCLAAYTSTDPVAKVSSDRKDIEREGPSGLTKLCSRMDGLSSAYGDVVSRKWDRQVMHSDGSKGSRHRDRELPTSVLLGSRIEKPLLMPLKASVDLYLPRCHGGVRHSDSMKLAHSSEHHKIALALSCSFA